MRPRCWSLDHRPRAELTISHLGKSQAAGLAKSEHVRRRCAPTVSMVRLRAAPHAVHSPTGHSNFRVEPCSTGPNHPAPGPVPARCPNVPPLRGLLLPETSSGGNFPCHEMATSPHSKAICCLPTMWPMRPPEYSDADRFHQDG